MAYTQEERLLAISTPLGEDKLLLRSFAGREGISRLFQFRLDLVSEDASINFDSLIGKNVTFAVKLQDRAKGRYFNGYVSRFAQLPGTLRLGHYEMELVPWMWFLTRTTDCRIFQNKNAKDIIEKVFKDFGFNDFEFQLRGSPRTREYCVQYRETAFSFVSRLMEEEGIFYFFKHENGKHTLVMADAATACENCPEQSDVKFELAAGQGYNKLEDTVLSWHAEKRWRAGQATLRDFNFETPTTDLSSNVRSTVALGQSSKFELFDYPGLYTNRGEGDKVAQWRMEEEEASHIWATGESDVRTFCSGFKFQLQEHPRDDQNMPYVLVEVMHTGEEGGFYSGEGSQTTASYRNQFVAIPASVPYRPPRTTRRPTVEGPQTAFVTGPAGEEIHVDKYGRVKVQFHWDRDGKMDDASSCWLRVSQPWAGKGWGAMWHPRIGQEVVVSFLEGDPDRPLVTGRVYNAGEMPAYALPDNKTMSYFKSYSSKGGGGFNELRFEDKKGSEQIFLHAEKNFDWRTKNDTFEWVGHDRHLIVKNDVYEEITNDRHVKVKRHDQTEIVQDQHLKVSGKQAMEITGSQSRQVGGSVIDIIKGSHFESVTGTVLLKAAMIVIKADSGISIKCGGSSVKIGPSGVTIKGSQIVLDGSMVRIASGPGEPADDSSPESRVAPQAPTAPKEAAKADPGQMSTHSATPRTMQAGSFDSTKLKPFKAPAAKASPSSSSSAAEPEKPKSWIEIDLKDEEGKPVAGEPFTIVLPDGSTAASGTTDEKGHARVEGFDPGSCRVVFTNLDNEAWRRK